jgi:hypothetical protein
MAEQIVREVLFSKVDGAYHVIANDELVFATLNS